MLVPVGRRLVHGSVDLLPSLEPPTLQGQLPQDSPPRLDRVQAHRVLGVWQRFCPKRAIRPRTPSSSRTSYKRLRPFAIGRQLRTRFVFREMLVRQRRTPEGAENSGVVTDAGDHCMPSRSSSSPRSYVEGELVFTLGTPGITANRPVCLESLPYPIPGRWPAGIGRTPARAAYSLQMIAA
jgi:hypothetical protein